MRLRALPFLTTTQHKGGVSDDSNINEHSIRGSQFEGEDDNNTAVHNFELGFFALPGDLQVQIIASLDIPDILSLRTTSREWHNLISVNERPIARAFLEQDAIPQFATSLYSLPPPTEINLHYICSLRHRLLVSASLSAMMAEWITKDMFLRKTEAQWLKFLPEQARLRNRLVPLLFTAFHFFEILRNLCMEQTLERGQTLPLKGRMLQAIESKIMNTYNDETLLEVHQIFPLLISFLCSKLRPPSYLSRLERSLLGYHMVAPPDHVIAAILCVGGLREVTKFSKVQGYERRRTAVDIWYNSISSQPIKEYPRQEITDSKCNTNLGTNYGSSQSTKSERVYSKKLKSNQSLLNNASLAAGPPMAFLPLECMPRLLQGLPVLQQIWVSTAESLLLERGVVERKGDIKKNAQVLRSLVDGSVTNADIRFWGDSADDVLQEK
ncbi:hypothetical protein BGZ60DRAFT_379039 [Tricladium varicosporioides]|nr:hypothetical protein BGZ60DRAFT_379039 [Hymenoscyphus varicosporioides]